MQLIQVYDIRVQSAQTGFTLLTNVQKVIILTKRYPLLRFIDFEAKLRCDDSFIAFSLQGTRQNPFAVTCAIVCGGIKKIDAKVQRSLDGAN
jgi:hypothetical protein